MKNFVTYANAEFHPGPNLNMVIGPNGTGKSTLVCAICLGLGWSTVHLGRAKDISEFVKHGSRQASIEIELAADPARHDTNPVITTKITKEGSKTDFFVDGRKSTKKNVQELARSFSIQVDNLCQFLPQDRVVEFAALSPVDLLSHTQRAAAPEYMSDWHEQLKAMRKEQKTKEDERQNVFDSLKSLQNRQRAQEPDVARIRERSSLQERLDALEKFRPLPKYSAAKTLFREAKETRKQKMKEQKRLEKQLEPNLRAAKEKDHYVKQIVNASDVRKRLVTRHEATTSKLRTNYETCETDLKEQQTKRDAERQKIKEVKKTRARHLCGIQGLRRQMENEPPVVDFAEMNARIRERTRQIRQLDDQDREISDIVHALNGQGKQRMEIIEQKRKRKTHLQSQVGQQATKLGNVSSPCAQAWEWIEANREQFTGKVFGPPMLECSIKEKRHSAAVEAVLQRGELLAFTVTTKDDFDLLQRKLYGEMHLSEMNIRQAPEAGLSAMRRPCSDEQLRRLGLEAWVIDLIDGPEPVLAMLCDTRAIHQVGFTSGEISSASHDALKDSPVSIWVTSKESYQVTRRREYGDKAVSTRVQPVRAAQYFTNAPVSHEAERAIDRDIVELEDECSTLKAEIQREKSNLAAIEAKRAELVLEKTAIEEDKNVKQANRTRFDALPTKLEGEEQKLADAESRIRDYVAMERGFDDEADGMHLKKGQFALDYASAVEQLRQLHLQQFEAEIRHIEAVSDLQQLQSRHAHDGELLEQLEGQVAELQKTQNERHAAALALAERCKEISTDLTEFELSINEEIQQLDVDQLETEIQTTKARLEMTAGGNASIIGEYEDRAKKIERRSAQYAEIASTIEGLAGRLEEIQSQWEPQLDELVGKISAAFAENFAQIQCAGEVGVYKDDDDFEQWAIQIKVKFREHEPLSVLDSHRQSGGERAVSTIFYLMALQSLARAPFRVVDEINQGMDPRNERYVLVVERVSSQMFANVGAVLCTHAWSRSLARRRAKAAEGAVSTSSSRPSC